jgi:hypothetical protein
MNLTQLENMNLKQLIQFVFKIEAKHDTKEL